MRIHTAQGQLRVHAYIHPYMQHAHSFVFIILFTWGSF